MTRSPFRFSAQHAPADDPTTSVIPESWDRRPAARGGIAPPGSWVILDTALEVVDRELAAPEPECGAALIGPSHSRLVTDVIVDPVRGQRAEYWHSDPLRELVTERLSTARYETYLGTAHSHPAGLARPSEPDRTAFRSVHDTNPFLRNLLFPIVVNQPVQRIHRSFHGPHLLDLPHGTLAAFVATPDGTSTHISPVETTILPVGRDTRAVADQLGWEPGPVRVLPGPDGNPWLAVDLTEAGEPRVQLLLPATYPMGAPLLRTRRQERFSSPAWRPGVSAAEQLAAALLPSAPKTSSTAPPTTMTVPLADEVDAGLRARLAHHLPDRRDWHVTVLGNGSVGSTVAEALVRSGVTRISLVDPDRVEAANLSRTTYAAADIGRPKVEALSDRLEAVNPSVAVTAHAVGIDDLLASHPSIDKTDMIVLATDDDLAELHVNAAAFPVDIPMLSIKLYARGDAGEIILVDPGVPTPCLRCVTHGRTGRGDRRVDYGSGRLVAELALGPDIAGVAQRATKIALAMLARRDGGGVLASWIEPLLLARRTMHLTANVADWPALAQLTPPPLDGPYSSVWVHTAPDPGCVVCGHSTDVPDDDPASSSAVGTLPADDTAWTMPEGTSPGSPPDDSAEEHEQRPDELA